MARKATQVALTDSERAWVGGLLSTESTPERLRRRLRVALGVVDGQSNDQIAQEIGYCVMQISRIRGRLARHGLAGIFDRPRPGRPRCLTESQIAEVVACTLGPGQDRRSIRAIAAHTGLSHMTVSRIRAQHGLDDRTVSNWFRACATPDRVVGIGGLYLGPQGHVAVVCVEPYRLTADQLRKILSQPRATRTPDSSTEMLEALDGSRKYSLPRREGLLEFINNVTNEFHGYRHFIIDDRRTINGPRFKSFRRDRIRVRRHFPPTGASWLRMVEVWFAEVLRRYPSEGLPDRLGHLSDVLARAVHRPLGSQQFIWRTQRSRLIRERLTRETNLVDQLT